MYVHGTDNLDSDLYSGFIQKHIQYMYVVAN